MLLLFELRPRHGLAFLFVFVGGIQFLQTVLAGSVSVELFGGLSASPGSAALFGSTLFAVLLVYIRAGVQETRTLICAVILANLLLVGVLAYTRLQDPMAAQNMGVFWMDLGVHTVGTALLIVDAVLLVVLFELLARGAVPLPARICVTLLAVLSLDSVVWVGAAEWGDPEMGAILAGHVAGKVLAGLIYGLLLWGYLAVSRERVGGGSELERPGASRDPFSILTFRERYHALRAEKEEQEARLSAELGRVNEDLERRLKELEASEVRFRLLFEGAAVGMAVIDLDGRTEQANSALQRMLHFSEAELREVSLPNMAHPEDRPLALLYCGDLLAGRRESIELRIRLMTKEGEAVWVRTSAALVRDADLQPVKVVAVCRDVSKRVRLEEEVLHVSALERQRLGRDLHDGLGQQLAGLALLAESLKRRLEARGAAEAREAADLQQVIGEATAHTRFLTRGMVALPGESSLADALRELARSASRLFRISIDEDIDDGLVVGSAASRHLYAIAQEAVTNAVRHGGAKHIVLGLEVDETRVRLSISDDGGGFPDGVEPPPGVGLRSMRYRAAELGGELRVEDAGEGGLIVDCTVPNTRQGSGGRTGVAS